MQIPVNHALNCACDLLAKSRPVVLSRLLADNIFAFVTTHENPLSVAFYQYCSDTPSYSGERSPEKLLRDGGKRMSTLDQVAKKHLQLLPVLKRDIRSLEPREVLIYTPIPKYFDVGRPVYEALATVPSIRPIVLHERAWQQKWCAGCQQISARFSYVSFLTLKALYRVRRMTPQATGCPRRDELLRFLYSHLWRAQVVNELRRYRLREVLARHSNIIGIVNTIPTTSFGRLLDLEAKAKGIPSYSFIRGLLFWNVENHFIESSVILGKGQYDGDILVRSGLNKKSHIVLIGAPFLKEANRETLQCQVTPPVKTMLFVDQPPHQGCSMQVKDRLVKAICRVSRQEGIKCIVKLHPSTRDSSFYYRIAGSQGFKDLIIAAGNEDFDNVAERCQVVVASASTVLLNCLHRRKPIILLGEELFEGVPRNPFVGCPLMITVRSVSELEAAIKRFACGQLPRISEDEWQATFKQYVIDVGNNSAKRIADMVIGSNA